MSIESVSGEMMISYLPECMSEVTEIQNIIENEGTEFDQLNKDIKSVLSEAFISTASEQRISDWEKRLGIIPAGTPEQRRSLLLAQIFGTGKLSKSVIADVVNVFTGGDAIITFNNSVIDVKVKAPVYGDVFLFGDVTRALVPRIPAHIGLTVQRYYSSWQDIKSHYASWADIASLANWQTLRDYLS